MSDNVEFYDNDEDDFDGSDDESGLSEEQVRAFLTELAHLTMKHEIEIGAFGNHEPFLVANDAKHGFYDVDEDHEGLIFICGNMIQ